MSHIAILKELLKLIGGQEHDRAADMWSRLRNETGICRPCYHSPLPREIRCAACLHNRLDIELGKRANPAPFMDQIASAHQSLGAWIEARQDV